jgi:hypothetical protein
MIVEIPNKSGDNEKFMVALSSLIATIVAEKSPTDLYVTRINKWFDHKWLGYSGKGRVEFEGFWPIDTALDPIWREKRPWCMAPPADLRLHDPPTHGERSATEIRAAQPAETHEETVSCPELE